MHRHADTLRVAGFLAEKFSIYTTDPTRLAKFARDTLESGITFTAKMLALKESLERVARW